MSRKTDIDQKIGVMTAASYSTRVISRRLFLYDQTRAFLADEDRGFSILNAICETFEIPFSSVRVAGSAQLGYSYVKKRDFSSTESDVDIAIISPAMFQQYTEYVLSVTRGYSDLSKFPRQSGVSTDRQFRDYMSAGYFRPDLMPHSDGREKWFSYFRRLSNEHAAHFKSINAGIFLSESLFEMRNESTVRTSRKGSQ